MHIWQYHVDNLGTLMLGFTLNRNTWHCMGIQVKVGRVNRISIPVLFPVPHVHIPTDPVRQGSSNVRMNISVALLKILSII